MWWESKERIVRCRDGPGACLPFHVAGRDVETWGLVWTMSWAVSGWIMDQCGERLKSGNRVEASIARLCLETLPTWS